MSHPYPHFLVVGFMKAATTTLFEHLIAHPGIQPPVKKELHYFTRELDPFYDPALFGLEYFEQLRYDAASEKLCGEASPSYIVAANRIASFNPNVKIIVLLRDPVERALSQFRQYREYQMLPDDPATLNAESIESMNFVQDSLYAPHVSTFIDHFPAHNILLISFEEFCAAQHEAMKHVFRFLNLVPLAIDGDKKLSESLPVAEPAGLRHRLEAFFADKRGETARLIAEHGLNTFPKRLDAFERY